MDRLLCSSRVILMIHLFGLYLAFAQDNINMQFSCPGFVTSSGVVSTNLEQVLNYLVNTNTNFTYGFANFAAGQTTTPDVVNGIALCIADLEHKKCLTCLNDASRRLLVDCPKKIEAIGWLPDCMLRYSNRSIFNTVETEPSSVLDNPDDAPDKDRFNSVLGPLIDRIAGEAATNVGGLGKFASGQENVTGGTAGNLTMYGLVQCTPDLTEGGCRECLDDAINYLRDNYDGRIGARLYKPSCVIRYETYNFFNPPEPWVDPAPPPFFNQSEPRVDPAPPPDEGNNRKHIVVIVATTLSVTAVATVITVLGVYRWRRIKREQQEEQILLHGSEASTSFSGLQTNEDERGDMHFFNLKTIQEATNSFSTENKLGEGGFGPVYKGKLNDGRVVAVKRLSVNSGQGLREFRTEGRLIVKLQHKNLVKLLGCCTQKGEKLLIYEFMPNNSLNTFLFDKARCKELDWPMRANIIGGIAKGLRYLHEDSRLRIVHRDMKASNVLLDNDFNAKISDFGTARIFGGNQIDDETNRIVGTYGYMAPEYAMEGVFSTKSDVYSFGVLFLEIITGQKNNAFSHPDHKKSLQSYARTMWKEGTAEKLIDENIRETCLVTGEATRWTNIALLCIQENPNDRPAMSSVVFMLEGQWASLPQPSEPPFSAFRFIISDQSSSSGTGAASNQFSTSDLNTS